GSRLKESALRDQHLWIGRSYLPEARQVQLVSLPRVRNDLLLILRRLAQGVLVGAKRRRRPRSQHQLNSPRFTFGEVEFCARRSDGALVAVENRDSHADLSESFRPRLSPKQSRVGRFEQFSAVTHSTAQEEIRRRLGFGASERSPSLFNSRLRVFHLRTFSQQRGQHLLQFERG